MLVNTRGSEGSAAGPVSYFAAFEISEELVPFLFGGCAVLLAGVGGPAAGDEGTVTVDDFFGVDGLVAHGRVDVFVSADQLGDVRGHAVEDGVGDEQPTKVVGDEVQRLVVGVGESGSGQGGGQQRADGFGVDRPVLHAVAALQQ